jgi:hypothetical protein
LTAINIGYFYRFLADGGHYYTIGDGFRLGRNAVCTAVHQGVDAIVGTLFQRMIDWPVNALERQQIPAAFYPMSNMPSVGGVSCMQNHTYIVGCVDGTHVSVIPPSQWEGQFVNRHRRHSITCQMTAGPRMQLYDAYVNCPGSMHDARMFRLSLLHARWLNGYRPFQGGL